MFQVTGTIVQIGGDSSSGAQNSGLSVGDRVVATFIMPCGACYYCEHNLEDICDTFFAHNRLKVSGGFVKKIIFTNQR